MYVQRLMFLCVQYSAFGNLLAIGHCIFGGCILFNLIHDAVYNDMALLYGLPAYVYMHHYHVYIWLIIGRLHAVT